jgi:hypothetical protein
MDDQIHFALVDRPMRAARGRGVTPAAFVDVAIDVDDVFA